MSSSSDDPIGEVTAILARVLKISAQEAIDARRGDIDEWSSLKHIEIIFQVEDEFGVQFAEDDIAELVDLPSIVAAVIKNRGS